MGKRFTDALDAHVVPNRLGDVRLSYDSSLLIGSTVRPRTQPLPAALAALGLALLVSSGALVVFAGTSAAGPMLWALALAIVAALALVGSSTLERVLLRQRRFVLNFAADTLRLELPARIQGLPRTLVLPFDDVREVATLEAPDGTLALTVDVLVGAGTRRQVREVLVADVASRQTDDLMRLARFLRGAFGLGAPTPS